MIGFKIYKAKEKDIEIITSMKMLVMINDDLDYSLSDDDKQKLRDNIIKNIKKDYKNYNIIVLDDKTIGAYSLFDYSDGVMIDQIYLFEEYRKLGIGSRIIKQIISTNDNVYSWCYKDSDAVTFFRKLGFLTNSQKGSTVILKYQLLTEDVFSPLKDVICGYKDKAGNRYLVLDQNFKDRYYLQNADELLETKIGLCFDQVELERKILQKIKFDLETYYLMYSNVSFDASHTFLIYEYSGKIYWFENSWVKYRGIHEYDNKKDCLKDIVEKFIATIEKGNIDNVRLFKYDKPRFGVGYGKLINHYINGEKIKIKDLYNEVSVE